MENKNSFKALPGMVGRFRIGWWVKHPSLKNILAMICTTEGEGHETLVVFNKTNGWQKIDAKRAERVHITPAQFLNFAKSLEAAQIGKDRWQAIQKALKTVDEGESLQKVCARVGTAAIHTPDYSKHLFLPTKAAKREPKVEDKPVTTEQIEQKAEAPKAEAQTA